MIKIYNSKLLKNKLKLVACASALILMTPNPTNTKAVTKEYIETTIESEEETLLDTAEKDEEITEYILEEMENLQEQIDNKDDNNIKKSAKKLFITLIDFIFFDKEIKGVTYNELSEGVKQQLYDELCTINTLIDQYLPDTKESISETYNAYKKYLTPYYYDFIDTIKSYIGEENLKDLKDLKDNLGEDLYSFYTKKKAKLKEKYQNWKEE